MRNLSEIKKGDIVYLSAGGPYHNEAGEYPVSSIRGDMLYILDRQGRRHKFDRRNGSCRDDHGHYYRLWRSKEVYDAHQEFVRKKDEIHYFFQNMRYSASDEDREAVCAIYDLLVEKGMIQHERK